METSQYSFTLPISGKKVDFFNIEKTDGHMLLKARMLSSDSISVGLYIISQVCTIDNQKTTIDEILDLDFEDVIELENNFYSFKKKLISK